MPRRKSTKLIGLKNKAKQEGWLKWLREGPGEEADERALLNGCRFSIKRGEHFVRYVDRFGTLTEGAYAGKKFDLLDWQHNAGMRFFGWVKESPEWGCTVRRFKTWYEEVPKKSGKTPLASVVGNYLFFADSVGRQINQHTVATTRKQAERLLKHATRQVKNNRHLSEVAVIKKLEGFESMEYGNNLWTVLAADPESADGINGHVIADEIHRWKGFEFFNTLRWALASQPEGVFLAITTAGDDLQSVCRVLHEKTKAVNSGRQTDEQFFGEIYAADKTDDPHDEETWHKANPSLGTTRKHPLKLSTFRADYEAAKSDPSQWPAWLQLRLNIWRTGVDSWIDELGGIAQWDAGDAARRSNNKRIDCFEAFTPDDVDEHECYVAFDGATHHDTTAAVFLFVDPDTDELVRVIPHFWLPRAEAEKQQQRVPYQQWSESGHITITEGDAVDFATVQSDLVGLINQFRPSKLFYDPMFQAEYLLQRIEDETGVDREEFPQTITHFAPVMAAAARLIVLHKLRHNGNPVLTWQLSHAQARSDSNNNRRPVKRQKNDYKTIDGVVAMVMALTDAIAGEEQNNYYEDHEVEFV